MGGSWKGRTRARGDGGEGGKRGGRWAVAREVSLGLRRQAKGTHLLEANRVVAASLPLELGDSIDDLLAQLGLLAGIGLILLLGEVGGGLGRQAEGLVQVAVDRGSGGSCEGDYEKVSSGRARLRSDSKLTLLAVGVDLGELLRSSSAHIKPIVTPISTKIVAVHSTHIDIPISILSELASEVERSDTATVAGVNAGMTTRLHAHVALTPRLLAILLPAAFPALLDGHALLVEVEDLSLLVENTELELLVEEAVDLRVDSSVDTVVEVAVSAVVVVPGHRVVGEGDVGFVGDVGLAGLLGVTSSSGSGSNVGKVPVVSKVNLRGT